MRRCIWIGFMILGTSLWGQEEVTEVTQVGQIVPEFSVTTLDGKNLNILDLRGKVVLINFFATWCGPCNQEMPHLEKEIWEAYKDKAFTVLSIAREHNAEEAAAFRKEKGLTFPMAPDPERKVYSLFATQFIPRNILIDKEGKIVFQEKGFDQEKLNSLVEKIEQLLKE